MEKVWLDILEGVVIGAIITAAVSLVGGTVKVIFDSRNTAKKVEEHAGMSRIEHKEIKDCIKGNESAVLLGVNTMLNHQKELDEKNYELLSKDQARIVDSIKNVQILPQELMRLNGEVARLTAKVESLGVENRELRTQNQGLKELAASLRKQVKFRDSHDKAGPAR